MAWGPLGWSPAFFAEVDKFPSSVLAHHYGSNMPGEPYDNINGVPNYGDMSKFKEWPDHANLDVLVGGTPCQSFSVVGLRKGLDDPRGNLALVYLALADRYRPDWLVWENVPGVLSSNGGRDFGAFLGGLVKLGYGFCYRVLDAQYIRVDGYARAVPQRRRRVFVVGYLGDWRRAAAVLFEPEGMRGDTPPRREAGERVAEGASHCAPVGSTLNSHFGDKMGLENQHVNEGCPLFVATSAETSPSLRAQAQDPHRDDDAAYVAHSLRGEGFDASEDGTGRGTPLAPVCVANQTSGFQSEVVGFAQNQRDEVRQMDVAGALAAEPGMKQQTYVAFSCKDCGNDAADNVSPTLRSMGADKSHANAGGQLAVAIQERAVSENLENGPGGKGYQEGIAYTLEARNKVQSVACDMAVRRLTPRECERLQGFPDDYTLIPYRGKDAGQCPDGPRYKALGNSMAVNVMRWIGQRIQIMETLP